MNREQANYCTKSYLQAFRNCPDNPAMSLDQWRTTLWQTALPDNFKHLQLEIYESWLKLRYAFLDTSFEDHKVLLQQLRKSYLLAIITNGPSAAQWEKIQKLKLQKYFDFIVVSDDIHIEKPDARIFHTACNYLGLPPGECIIIGDKLETDIQVISHFVHTSLFLPIRSRSSGCSETTFKGMKMDFMEAFWVVHGFLIVLCGVQ